MTVNRLQILTFDALVEGLNRSFFRQALASEVYESDDYWRSLFRRPYNIIDGHESSASFFAILMGSPDDGKRTLEKAEEVFEEHPVLLFAAVQNFNISQDFKDALTRQTGMSWQEILMALDPDFDPP